MLLSIRTLQILLILVLCSKTSFGKGRFGTFDTRNINIQVFVQTGVILDSGNAYPFTSLEARYPHIFTRVLVAESSENIQLRLLFANVLKVGPVNIELGPTIHLLHRQGAGVYSGASIRAPLKECKTLRVGVGIEAILIGDSPGLSLSFFISI